jgi:hypothetical protein
MINAPPLLKSHVYTKENGADSRRGYYPSRMQAALEDGNLVVLLLGAHHPGHSNFNSYVVYRVYNR